MRILRKGTLPQNILYVGTCTNCSCKVEASYTEVRRDRYSGEFVECYILCPTQGCGRRINMVEKPTPVSEEMDKAFKELFEPLPNRTWNSKIHKEVAKTFGRKQTLSDMSDDL